MNNVDDKHANIVCDDNGKLLGLRRHAEEINKLVINSLFTALLSLMTDKDYDKITITELCKKAGVSRSAFYGNFSGKDDIFERIVNYMNDELLLKIGSPFRSTTTKQWYERLFEFVAERATTYKQIIAAGFADRYMDHINLLVMHDSDISDDDKYRRMIWSGGILKATVFWLESDMAISIKHLAEICEANLKPWSLVK